MLWIVLIAATLVVGAGALAWLRSANARRRQALGLGTDDGSDGGSLLRSAALRLVAAGGIVVIVLVTTFNQIFFYAEPGYVYHVRTITGQERVVDGVGYSMYLFGRVNAWKKAMSVQAERGMRNGVDAEADASLASARLKPINIMFLDQVDADAMATVRFRLPTDTETFLHMAHEYRTPENLLRVALIPSFQETLQATASLMSAEDYYSGGRTEFISEFENQMQGGIYLVVRKEVRTGQVERQVASADASNPKTKARSPQPGGRLPKRWDCISALVSPASDGSPNSMP